MSGKLKAVDGKHTEKGRRQDWWPEISPQQRKKRKNVLHIAQNHKPNNT